MKLTFTIELSGIEELMRSRIEAKLRAQERAADQYTQVSNTLMGMLDVYFRHRAPRPESTVH